MLENVPNATCLLCPEDMVIVSGTQLEMEQIVRLGSDSHIVGDVAREEPIAPPMDKGGTLEVSNRFASLSDQEVVLETQVQLIHEASVIKLRLEQAERISLALMPGKQFVGFMSIKNGRVVLW